MKCKKLVDFTGAPIKAATSIAYCKHEKHPGHITKGLILSHECLRKRCDKLCRTQEGYWERLSTNSARDLIIHGMGGKVDDIIWVCTREQV